MPSPPRGTLFLCKSPLSKDNEHQIKFSSTTEQQTWFNSLEGLTLQYNYIRNEGYMVVPIGYYEALQYNYLVFQNSYVNNKWFFCYIDRIEFSSDNSTVIYLANDVWQTWQFDVELQKSFIERRHFFNITGDRTSDNLNPISDNVSPGELTVYDETNHFFNGVYLVFCNSDVTHLDLANATTHKFSMGDYQIPCMVLCYKLGEENLLNADLQAISNAGVSDRINSVVYVPCSGDVAMFNLDGISSDIVGQTIPVCSGVDNNNINDFIKTSLEYDFSIFDLGHLKTLTYPYSKIVVQDMTTGQQIELQPNRFLNKKATFEIQTNISETPSYRIIPTNYKGQDKAFSDSLVIKCNTSLPIANNTYAKYLMNNQDINNLKVLGSGIGMVASAVGGSPMGSITGFESITNVMLQEQQAQRQPNQLTAISDGAMERILLQNGIKIMFMTMDVNHLNSANDYWTMFGYPLKQLQEPTIFSTLDYQFIKTQNANINGDIPQNDLIEIQNIFNKGVTMWKKDKFRQY